MYPGGLWSILPDDMIEDDEAIGNIDHIVYDTDDVVKGDEGIPQVNAIYTLLSGDVFSSVDNAYLTNLPTTLESFKVFADTMLTNDSGRAHYLAQHLDNPAGRLLERNQVYFLPTVETKLA